MSVKAYSVKINGIVQGVGFRPHVYRLAVEYNLKGWVINSSAGVVLEVEGEEEDLREFIRRLQNEPPPRAVIRSCEIRETPLQGFTGFTIKPSDDNGETTAMISPDIAVCSECKKETGDENDRRYRYPFTNCTNCGPRFTIIKALPYDRAMTTMAKFTMCPECQAEFDDPLNRRFHAQPNACPICGPRITLVDSNGVPVDREIRDLLKSGYIVAVKGLGGFHLAANALDAAAVMRLRQRKRRDAKPFAVMVRDLATAHQHCIINSGEEALLASPAAPIVVLKRREDSPLPAEAIHPGLKTLGVMLPYTPLHYMLFDDELRVLIMTSANISDEPLITVNEEAMEKLGSVADFFLMHNRDIYNPCDDSVVQFTKAGTVHFMRRARGYVPEGISLGRQVQPVLALGGEMKNTFCITRGSDAFLSQHWGDLNHYQNYVSFLRGIERFKSSLEVEPQILAHDLHPDYQTTRWAKEQKDIRRVEVQHHHAHMASVMAENGLQGEVLGLICDGSGWGTDGTVWGGEILRGDFLRFERVAHLRTVPLPGGDLSARRPYRMGLVYLLLALGESGLDWANRLLPDLAPGEKELLVQRVRGGSREPVTTSCGRLFDAVAAVLGICGINRYEGQAAVELEACADPAETGNYGFSVEKQGDRWVMNVMPMWSELIADIKGVRRPESMAMKFHLTLVRMFEATLLKLRDETGLNRVVLSGGVFHNQILLANMLEQLTNRGFMVYHQQKVPPGDGGISLGQAVIASEVGG